mgnify:CR=1 FL=1
MRPALDERAAPDPVSGAVSFHPDPPLPFHPDPTLELPSLGERDFWRAVGATVLVTLRPWLR